MLHTNSIIDPNAIIYSIISDFEWSARPVSSSFLIYNFSAIAFSTSRVIVGILENRRNHALIEGDTFCHILLFEAIFLLLIFV